MNEFLKFFVIPYAVTSVLIIVFFREDFHYRLSGHNPNPYIEVATGIPEVKVRLSTYCDHNGYIRVHNGRDSRPFLHKEDGSKKRCIYD